MILDAVFNEQGLELPADFGNKIELNYIIAQSVTERKMYAVSASNVNAPASWSEEAPTITNVTPYLWMKTLTRYTTVAGEVFNFEDGGVVIGVYDVTHSGNKNNPHGVTAAQVGAAPSGYGLGNAKLTTTNIDEVCTPGWYCWNYTMTIGGVTANYWYMKVSAYGTGSQHCLQEIFPVTTSGYCKIVRRKHAGVWGAAEVETPPMIENIEYLSTERIADKAIYKKNVGGVVYCRKDGETTWKPYAEIIGARPNTWTPTASDVGARPNTWMPSATDVGAAPSGYGLGGATSESANLNDATACGWYAFTTSTLNRPFNYGMLMVVNRYGNQVTQIAFNPWMSSYGEMCIRHFYTAWTEWEYINPPMIAGQEYRTTERHKGKVVYTKLISFGSLPASGSNNVTTGISGATLVSLTGTFFNGAEGEPYPIMSGTGAKCLAWVTSGCSKLYAQAIADCSKYTGEFIIKYTKD